VSGMVSMHHTLYEECQMFGSGFEYARCQSWMPACQDS
jgi:hypothetical protein